MLAERRRACDPDAVSSGTPAIRESRCSTGARGRETAHLHDPGRNSRADCAQFAGSDRAVAQTVNAARTVIASVLTLVGGYNLAQHRDRGRQSVGATIRARPSFSRSDRRRRSRATRAPAARSKPRSYAYDGSRRRCAHTIASSPRSRSNSAWSPGRDNAARLRSRCVRPGTTSNSPQASSRASASYAARSEIAAVSYCVDPQIDAEQRYNIVNIELELALAARSHPFRTPFHDE